MKRICLDTSAYSHFMRGHVDVHAIITSASIVEIPVVVLGELRMGFRLGSKAAENSRRLDAFCSEPVVEVIDIDDETATHYADIVADLRKRGHPLPTNDLWIAATAARQGSPLITFDEHFAKIDRIACKILRLS